MRIPVIPHLDKLGFNLEKSKKDIESIVVAANFKRQTRIKLRWWGVNLMQLLE